MVTGKEGRREKEGENSLLNAEAVHCIGEVSRVQMKEGRGRRRGGGGSSLLESEGRVEVGHFIDQVSSPSQRLSYL